MVGNIADNKDKHIIHIKYGIYSTDGIAKKLKATPDI